MAILWRYRWELAPLAVLQAVNFTHQSFPESISPAWAAAVAAATLGIGLRPAVKRRRPLLTALWALSFWQAAARPFVSIFWTYGWLTGLGIGFDLTLVRLGYFAIAIGLAAWLARRALRDSPVHAFAVPAIYLAVAITSTFAVEIVDLPVAYFVTVLAQHVTVLLLIVMVVAHLPGMRPSSQRRTVLLLLLTPLVLVLTTGLTLGLQGPLLRWASYELLLGLTWLMVRRSTTAPEGASGNLGHVVGGITGLVAGGSLGLGCLWWLFICSPIFGIAGAISGAALGGGLAVALDPTGDGVRRRACAGAGGVISGVAGGIAGAVGCAFSIIVIVGLAVVLVWQWQIAVPLVLLLLVALTIRGRVRRA